MIFRYAAAAFILSLFFLFATPLVPALTAQNAAWQQRVDYEMDIRMNVETNQFSGSQLVTYHNVSPDTLHRFFYHLYYNAFQPGSMMDTRSRTIIDPDGRVRDRIYHLTEDEIGFQNILSLKQNGQSVSFEVSETILSVNLSSPILPGETVIFEMEFEAQVPLQIRRTGRDNREGIRYSMSQWYPKVAAYDQDGWHTPPYVAREFHGNFGDFDVRITIDRNYTLGATGYLQNPQQVGHGYEDPELPLELPEGDELTWHFFAPEVIDFFWGAHDEFIHVIHEEEGSPRIHMLYVERPETRFWEMLGEFTAEAFRFMNEYIGPYPYEQFTIIQGGDGGMEYPMGTLITGHRPLWSLVGVTVHELIHMWYQSTLATNETLYHWMDEGFTVYMSDLVMWHLFQLPGDPHASTYRAYLRLVHDGLEEYMGQHADRYDTNAAYSMASYRKGSLILHQLEYIIGRDAMKRTMQRYYRDFAMRHPTPVDFQRIAEEESGMQLRWYFDEMLYSTRTIDIGIDRVRNAGRNTTIRLSRDGIFHMPVDLLLTYADGTQELIYIPTQQQLGIKAHEHPDIPRTVLEPWPWTHATYEFTLEGRPALVTAAEIDPSNRLADINRLNNRWPFPAEFNAFQVPEPDWNTYQTGVRPALWYGERAGLRVGGRLSGRYLFNTKALDAELWLTTGTLEDPSASNLDADYRLSWRDRLPLLGPDSWWQAETGRFYGVHHQRLAVERRLGRFGRLERTRRVLSLDAFHLNKDANRQIGALSAQWERGSLIGAGLSFEQGDVSETGILLRAETATFYGERAAQQVQLRAGYTWFSSDFRYRVRFGLQAAGGSGQMAQQQRYNLGSGTAIERWQNRAFTATANIDGLFYEDARLSFDSGNALSGYSLHTPGRSGLTGNNMLAFSVWQSYRPFLRGNQRAFELEVFSGTGLAWDGSFATDFSLPSASSPWLASTGAGIVFDFSELPRSARYTGQSALLSGLRVALRSPFYLHQAGDTNDFEPTSRWMIGVGKAF
ncbi:M1 family metallopeptidase [Cyclonatronum sp.]|uniref:M1 family metallopeptidase n=1 Tax=Cyclonatronum sp. TaxID=3024185 RepID=UPI0025B83005|nr:M1 family metallopeptidase [Cyclonatronum sp.]